MPQVVSFTKVNKSALKNETFESVVVAPQFPSEPFIHFYNKENNDWLLEIANEVMRLNEQRPKIWALTFVSLNSSRQITRYCRINRLGSIIFQRRAIVKKKNSIHFSRLVY